MSSCDRLSRARARRPRTTARDTPLAAVHVWPESELGYASFSAESAECHDLLSRLAFILSLFPICAVCGFFTTRFKCSRWQLWARAKNWSTPPSPGVAKSNCFTVGRALCSQIARCVELASWATLAFLLLRILLLSRGCAPFLSSVIVFRSCPSEFSLNSPLFTGLQHFSSSTSRRKSPQIRSVNSKLRARACRTIRCSSRQRSPLESVSLSHFIARSVFSPILLLCFPRVRGLSK